MEAEHSVSDNFLFWKTRTLIYEDAPLGQVFEELEEYFEQKIMVRNPEILQNRWNSVHRDQPFHEIMEELCLYFDLECIVRDDTIQVQSRQQ
jgi:ferric-dicitrate binding protein FerR (iron transport regulator)